MSIRLLTIRGYGNLYRSLLRFRGMNPHEARELISILNTANIDSFIYTHPDAHIKEAEPAVFSRMVKRGNYEIIAFCVRSDSKDLECAMSIQAIRRLPQYYNYLKLLLEAGIERVSSPAIAKRMGLNEVQVRKDLAAVSESGGTPRTGFNVEELVRDIGRYLATTMFRTPY